MSPEAPAPGSFEVQLHPVGGGRVRYFRLTRVLLTFGSVLALLYLLLLAAAVSLAPGAARIWLGSAEYRALTAERARHGERLLALVKWLATLQTRSEDLLIQLRKVSAAYELPLPAPQETPDGVPDPAAPGSIYEADLWQGERLQARIRGRIHAIETALAAVRAFEGAHPDRVREMPAVCPLRGDQYVLTSPFGRQRSAFTRDTSFHAGIDLAAPRGAPIRAPADGVVVFAGVVPLARSPAWWRFGNLVAVAHGDRYLTLYGHCGELKVAARQAVRRGEVLATVGSSGWSLSPHLHYEVRRRNEGGALAPVDPLLYILDRRWPNEERLLARTQGSPRAYEPLPPGLDPPAAARRR